MHTEFVGRADIMQEGGNFFPELRAMSLGFVGKVGKERLRRRFLMGQEITLRK